VTVQIAVFAVVAADVVAWTFIGASDRRMWVYHWVENTVSLST